MSAHTNIQWTDSTNNPTSGCDGCEILKTCYARIVHENRLAHAFPDKYAENFLEVRLIPGRMEQASRLSDLLGKPRPDKPWMETRPRHIFVSDMSDALSAKVPFEFLEREIVDNVVSEKGRRHVWQWLTKRPERMVRFALWLRERGRQWPDNLWAGTSVTNQFRLRERVPYLRMIPAKVRFLSIEPLLEPVDLFDGTCTEAANSVDSRKIGEPWIDWVICGGESGSNARPMDVEWARAIKNQCSVANVPFFMKQLGGRSSHRGELTDFPEDLRVREFPT